MKDVVDEDHRQTQARPRNRCLQEPSISSSSDVEMCVSSVITHFLIRMCNLESVSSHHALSRIATYGSTTRLEHPRGRIVSCCGHWSFSKSYVLWLVPLGGTELQNRVFGGHRRPVIVHIFAQGSLSTSRNMASAELYTIPSSPSSVPRTYIFRPADLGSSLDLMMIMLGVGSGF